MDTGSLSEDIYSAFVRCSRIVDPIEQILGGEVYHYHHKMMLKEPFVGGAWEWHQDYGYWYSNDCLFPCLIAIDRATTENGCLQVIKGSHYMGRIDHGKAGEQKGADMERVQEALKYLELVQCEMEPRGAELAGQYLEVTVIQRSRIPLRAGGSGNSSPRPARNLLPTKHYLTKHLWEMKIIS